MTLQEALEWQKGELQAAKQNPEMHDEIDKQNIESLAILIDCVENMTSFKYRCRTIGNSKEG